MSDLRQTNDYSQTDWRNLETYLTRNFYPVNPRAGFIDDLRRNLGSVGESTKQSIVKTRSHILSAFTLVAGLVIIALSIRIVVSIVSMIKSRSFQKQLVVSENS